MAVVSHIQRAFLGSDSTNDQKVRLSERAGRDHAAKLSLESLILLIRTIYSSLFFIILYSYLIHDTLLKVTPNFFCFHLA